VTIPYFNKLVFVSDHNQRFYRILGVAIAAVEEAMPKPPRSVINGEF